VSDGSAPVLVGNLNTPGTATNIKLVGTTAYVADDGGGLQIIDVTNPMAPSLLGAVATPARAMGVDVQGSFAYMADLTAGLQIIDVSNPASPTLTGAYNTPGLTFGGVSVDGSVVVVADYDAGLQIIDVSTPSAPALLGSFSAPSTEYWDVELIGDLAYVADASGWIVVVDISTPNSPYQVGSLYLSGSAFGITVEGNLAFVANSTGVQVIDVSDPSNPVLVDSYQTQGLAQGVVVLDELIYVADGIYGMSIFDPDPCGGSVSAVEMPGLAGLVLVNSPNPFNPATVFDFSIPQDGHVSLAIYSLAGRKVRSLVQSSMTAGGHSVRWNGLDDSGQRVASGVYFGRLEVGGVSEVRKVVMLK